MYRVQETYESEAEEKQLPMKSLPDFVSRVSEVAKPGDTLMVTCRSGSRCRADVKTASTKGDRKIMNTMLNRYGQSRFITGVILMALVLLSIIAPAALAQSPGSSGKGSDEWKFTLAPYLLLPWMNGKVAIAGLEHEVDVSPSQILQNLQFGAMGYLEARKAGWGVGVDAVYMALGTDVPQPSANVDVNQGAYTFLGVRQLNKKVDLLFGARWNVIQGKLEFKGPLLLGTFEKTQQWVEPVVGLRLMQRLGGRWSFTMEGDIGGFGAGSDFAWQLWPLVGFDLSKHATLKLGYRVLSEDYENGTGAQLFKYDVITQAIALGVAFNF
jgi:hypothetical protein